MSVRKQQKQETRRRILKISKALFSEHGFDVSMQKIAKESDIAAGTIFVHFSDKRELLVHVLFEDLKKAALRGLKELDAGKSILDQLLDCIAPVYRYYFRKPELSRTLLKEALFSVNEANKDLLRTQVSVFLEEIGKSISPSLHKKKVAVEPFLLTFFYLYLMNLLVNLNKPKQSLSSAIDELKILLQPIVASHGLGD